MTPEVQVFSQLALAAVGAAGAAKRTGEPQTLCQTAALTYAVMPSNLYAVLREQGADEDHLPLASFLPNGRFEVHPAGRTYPYFREHHVP